MVFIIVILIIALIIVYSARESLKEKNSSNNSYHPYNRNNSYNSNTDRDKLNRLKTLSDRLVLKTQEMADSLSEEGLTTKNNSMMIDVANDWETITDLYIELGDKANSLYIMMLGKRQPFPTFMFCMQGFLTEVQQTVEKEVRRSSF